MQEPSFAVMRPRPDPLGVRQVAVVLQHAVLGLVADRPSHGYQLPTSFDQAVGSDRSAARCPKNGAGQMTGQSGTLNGSYAYAGAIDKIASAIADVVRDPGRRMIRAESSSPSQLECVVGTSSFARSSGSHLGSQLLRSSSFGAVRRNAETPMA